MRDQARAAGRHDQRDRAQTGNCQAGGGNGRNPLHSTTDVRHNHVSLFIGYDNSHSRDAIKTRSNIQRDVK